MHRSQEDPQKQLRNALSLQISLLQVTKDYLNIAKLAERCFRQHLHIFYRLRNAAKVVLESLELALRFLILDAHSPQASQ